MSKYWISKKLLFRIHGWVGLNFGLLLFVVCLSGTIAVFSHEIDWLIDPAMQAESREEPINWTAISEEVDEAYPLHEVSFIVGPRHPGFAALVYATDPAGRFLKLYVDPYTGEVQGRNNFWNVQRFFRSFHRRMFVPGTWGIWLVTFFALVLLVSGVTGILFYRNWYRHLLRLRTADWRLFWSDSHRLAGVWSLLFLLIIVASGIWYMVEPVAPAPQPDEPTITEKMKEARGPAPQVLPLSQQIEIAKKAFPGFQARHVIPGGPDRATEVRGQAGAWLVRHRANRVRVDPVTGEVLSIQNASEVSLHHRIADMADPLHFGTFAGWTSQWIWLVFGLISSSLALTGGWLWHQRAEQKARTAGAGKHPNWSYAAAACPVIVLLASGIFGYLEARDTMGIDAPVAEHVVSTEIGPWRAELVRVHPRSPKDTAPGETVDDSLTVKAYLFADPGVPSAKEGRIHSSASAKNTSSDDERPFQEIANHEQPITATLSTTGRERRISDFLHLQVRSHRGELYQTSVDGAALFGAPSDETDRIPGPPEIPPAVWVVIGLYVALTLAVVAVWLIGAARTTETSSEGTTSTPGAAETKAARPVAADLPGGR